MQNSLHTKLDGNVQYDLEGKKMYELCISKFAL